MNDDVAPLLAESLSLHACSGAQRPCTDVPSANRLAAATDALKLYPAGLERHLPTRSSHHTTGPPAMIQNMCHDTPPWYQRYRAGNDWRVRASFSSGLPIARLSLDLELREY